MGRHNTIAGRKAAQDSRKAASFTKYTRAIIIAAKGGGDPNYNASLRTAIDKAKQAGLPNDNIKRAIQKGTGEIEGEQLEELRFEGYGSGGVAVIVEALTDNRNRTTSSVAHAFDKFAGNLGTPGCVSYMFDRKGLFVFDKETGVTEDQLMDVVLDAGADDINEYEDSFEVVCDPSVFGAVSDAIKNAGLETVDADITMIPSMETTPTADNIKHLKKMLDALEEDDDVQKVYTNSSIDLYEE